MKCCDINSGMLRTNVEFQRATKSSDGAGGYTETWAAIADAPTKAHVKSLSGMERFMSDRIEAHNGKRVTVRYFSGLLEADRVEIGGRAHNIRHIDNVEERSRWLVLKVDGGVAV